MSFSMTQLRSRHEDVSDCLVFGGSYSDSVLRDEEKQRCKREQARCSFAASIDGFSAMKFTKALAAVTERLKKMSNITAHQRRVLGLSMEFASEPLFVVDGSSECEIVATSICSSKPATSIPTERKTPHRALNLTTARHCSLCRSVAGNELTHWRPRGEAGKETQVVDEGETDVRGLGLRAAVCDRGDFSRLLAAAENEIDDLKYMYERDVRSLQEGVCTLRDVALRLHETERARHRESASAALQIAQYEEEITALRKLLSISIEKSVSSCGREKIEEVQSSDVKSLENALAVAARVNLALLEKAERRDAAYCSALREMDSLRREMAMMMEEAGRQKETYEERLKMMKDEIFLLNNSRGCNSMVNKEILQFPKRESMSMEYMAEVKGPQSFLNDTNHIVPDFKRQGTTQSPSLHWVDKVGHDMFTQSNTIVCCDAGVNTPEDGDSDVITSRTEELMHKIEWLMREHEKQEEELESLKHAHNIEIEFLTGNLLKAEEELRKFHLQANSEVVSQREQQSTSDASTRVVSG